MDMDISDDSNSLMKKFLWQMTGEEFVMLHHVAEGQQVKKGEQPKLIYGVHDLSVFIGCSESTIFLLKKRGVFDDAIVSRIGKKIVFDADKAKEIAKEYLKRKDIY